ncbi:MULTISPECIES: translation elongation factor Ts [Robiginitalea]|uniref:Elongation factor Ts n=1 Tax=Robiginitalea biformata (strain ATCC BAA-864 / DSM 15991 / KCTC 12146 / HTCC2501) TaxID=313596 RepID=A4CGD4_ROBBH|nr:MULTISPECIES: translation elongation factor Ts [Robiginitalea]EAR15992.1 elongation factor Ts [Robiginitalea biformata HTCC2501]MDC6354400.1 translation elongation factor Ts [Robiginitalea sp. PM2]MDC6374918.1 translation elongation factor Ts [Robiginitalea sp. SP8]
MVKITASEVNKLRKSTGAGMMDCKNALVEAEGDFDKAIEILRKKGQKVAAKRADRDSSEGAAIARVNDSNTEGVIVSLNCETDFVAKNDTFVSLAQKLAEIALGHASKEELLAADFEGISVQEKLIEQTGVIGEKIEIGDFRRLSAPFVGSYIHAGNKIATLVGLSAEVDGASEVAKDVAMQAAAMNPVALDESGVDQETIDKEIEIAKDQLREEGKPEAMLDNIAKGKLKRFFKDNTLVNQAFIKDGKISVAEYVKSADKDLKVTGFERVALG